MDVSSFHVRLRIVILRISILYFFGVDHHKNAILLSARFSIQLYKDFIHYAVIWLEINMFVLCILMFRSKWSGVSKSVYYVMRHAKTRRFLQILMRQWFINPLFQSYFSQKLCSYEYLHVKRHIFTYGWNTVLILVSFYNATNLF